MGILGFAIAAGMVQAGEIYKSIDADGKVVYSDHLPPCRKPAWSSSTMRAFRLANYISVGPTASR
jgi:hypothetical protein